MPVTVTLEQALDASSPIYMSCLNVGDGFDGVPFSVKLKAFELVSLLDRTNEECDSIKDDVANIVAFYLDMHASLTLAVAAAPSVGVKAINLKKLTDLRRYMQQFWSMALKSRFDVPPLPEVFTVTSSCEDYIDLTPDEQSTDNLNAQDMECDSVDESSSDDEMYNCMIENDDSAL